MRLDHVGSLILCLASLSGRAWAIEGESGDAYEIVAVTVVTILPDPLQEFFQIHLEALQRSATNAPANATNSSQTNGDSDWHYVMLDIAAKGDDRDDHETHDGREARRMAARRFPRNYTGAKNLYARYGVRAGGRLPWIITERYHALVQSFRNAERNTIADQAGLLLHFATDAALPLNTIADRHLERLGAFRWSTEDDLGSTKGTDVRRQRYQHDLVVRLRERLDYEVRVTRDRMEPVAAPLAAVFETLLDTHRSVDALAELDAAVCQQLGLEDRKAFAANREAYEEQIAWQAADLTEARLERAALLAAGLISAAWTDAGRPNLEVVARAGKSSIATPPSVADVEAGNYVGSSGSKIFHRAACPHVKRIKPENLVHFVNQREVQVAGRLPCRTCKPQRATSDSSDAPRDVRRKAP